MKQERISASHNKHVTVERMLSIWMEIVGGNALQVVRLTPKRARRIAAALLKAADEAEKGRK